MHPTTPQPTSLVRPPTAWRTAATACGAIALAAALALGGCGRPARDGSSITNKGSDTLFSVAQAWAEAYKKVDPAVGVSVQGGGSGVGIASMMKGTVEIANSSREMKDEEIKVAEEKGIHPVQHIVGYDAIAVYVHKDNPLESLTVKQLAEIYGEGGKTVKWSQLGITIPGHDEMVLASRQNNSGTYEYFKEAVLGGEREYKLGTRDMNGSKEVVDLVGSAPSAIGYSGLAFSSPAVKLVPIVKEGAAPVLPSIETAMDGTYPIARPLFMYTAGEPAGSVKEYMDWILSDTGQRILLDLGYAPVRKLD